jgi:hypothetical protein
MLPWIWLAIGLTFFYFSIVFYQYSKDPLRSFIVREGQQTRLDTEPDPEPKELNAFNELQRDFGRYLESINRKAIARNRIASIGFFLAAFGSFISAYLSLVSNL